MTPRDTVPSSFRAHVDALSCIKTVVPKYVVSARKIVLSLYSEDLVCETHQVLSRRASAPTLFGNTNKRPITLAQYV